MPQALQTHYKHCASLIGCLSTTTVTGCANTVDFLCEEGATFTDTREETSCIINATCPVTPVPYAQLSHSGKVLQVKLLL